MDRSPPLILLDLGPADRAAVRAALRTSGCEFHVLAGDDGVARPLPPRAAAGLLSDLSRTGALDRARALRANEGHAALPIAGVVAADAEDALLEAALAIGRVDFLQAPLATCRCARG